MLFIMLVLLPLLINQKYILFVEFIPLKIHFH